MIYQAIQRLLDYAIKHNLITKDDIFVARNSIIDLLALSDWQECESGDVSDSIDDILAPLIEYATEAGIIADTANSRDLFDTKIMGALTPMPREVIAEFNRKYEISPEAATDWYYDQSKALNYVRAGRISKDKKWEFNCEYGTLDITINLSKPEKDPKDIVLAKSTATSSYPKCQLCSENAGYAGHAAHPARQNLRPIPITVSGEPWQLQYSPYGYYSEHCIAFNTKHVPMKVDGEVFAKLFDIVDYLPHYFIGSNAGLPIVGGSILAHEHFQGGRYTFAMERAEIEREIRIAGYPEVKAGIVKWPMSVIRLEAADRAVLEKCAAHVFDAWWSYSDPSVMIYAKTDGAPHNTVTPIARKKGNNYVCDIVLRNNITTDERPLGLYHPKPSLHHIKKENIGLIEVMGLAILPARLAKELVLVEEMMLAGKSLDSDPQTALHADWAREVLLRHPEFCKDNARAIIEEEVGAAFLEVLMDAGVFKRTPEGQLAFKKFTDTLTE